MSTSTSNSDQSRGYAERAPRSRSVSPTRSRSVSPSRARDSTNGAHLLELKGHSDGVYSVAFSPDGKRIVSGSHDQTENETPASCLIRRGICRAVTCNTQLIFLVNTKVSNSKVRFRQMVLALDVATHRLLKTWAIPGVKTVYDVAATEEHLFVSTHNVDSRSSIRVLNMEGKQLREIGGDAAVFGGISPFFLGLETHGGLLYACDPRGHRVVVLRPDGTLVRSLGTDETRLEEPSNISIDDEKVYVVDRKRHSTVVFRPDGQFEKAFQTGSGDVIAKGGRLYILDEHDLRVDVFTTNGASQGAVVASQRIYSRGDHDLQRGLSIDPLGRLLLCRPDGLIIYDTAGTAAPPLGTQSKKSRRDGRTIYNRHVTAAASQGGRLYIAIGHPPEGTGNIVVMDASTHEVSETWTVADLENGGIIAIEATEGRVFVSVDQGIFRSTIRILDMEGREIKRIDMEEKHGGSPMFTDLCVRGGLLYACDWFGHRIVVFRLDGTVAKMLGSSASPVIGHPGGITLGDDEIYVTDMGACRVQVLDMNGQQRHTFGSRGESDGEYDVPVSVALHDNSLFVADRYNHRVQRMSLEGHHIGCIDTYPLEPIAILFDGDGRLLVCTTTGVALYHV